MPSVAVDSAIFAAFVSSQPRVAVGSLISEADFSIDSIHEIEKLLL